MHASLQFFGTQGIPFVGAEFEQVATVNLSNLNYSPDR